MTTIDDQYVPTEDEMRHAYWLTRMLDHHAAVDAAFDRFLARVRRDAAANALYEVATNIDNYDDYVMVHNRAKRIEETP